MTQDINPLIERLMDVNGASSAHRRTMTDAMSALKAAQAREAELVRALEGAHTALIDAHKAWDADEDMRVGKILLALLGHNMGYRRDTSAFAAWIRSQVTP